MEAVVAVGGTGVNVAVFSGTEVFVFAAVGGCGVNVAVGAIVFVVVFVNSLLGVVVVDVFVVVCTTSVFSGVVVLVAVFEGETVGDNEGVDVISCVPEPLSPCSEVSEFVISGF